MHIYGTSQNGISTYQGFFNSRKDSFSALLNEAANSSPARQAELLTRMQTLRNDMFFADKVVDILVKNITQLQV